MYRRNFFAGKALILIAGLALLASCGKPRETKKTYLSMGLYEAALLWDFAPNHHFSDGMVLVKDTASNLYGFRNTNGKLVIPCCYEMAGDFHDGLARVVVDGKNGFINHEGQTVVPPIYNRATIFSDGLAGVQQDGKWGYINAQGDSVTSFVYDFAAEFSDSMAFVKQDGKYGYAYS